MTDKERLENMSPIGFDLDGNENDIVRFIDGLGIVKYEEALASFYITYPFEGDWWNITIPDLFTDKNSQRLEVIGNTFENSELLDGTA